MKLRKSEYIVDVQYNDKGYLLLSTISGSMIFLDNQKYYKFKNNELQSFSCDEIQMLYAMNLLTSIDEKAVINNNRKFVLQDKTNNNIGLTILTTTKCNARCFYCYEKGIATADMSISTADKIVAYIVDKYKKYKLHISWFGGEPLVNSKIIDYISEALIKNGINFYSTMISNGSLFDRISLQQLEIWKLKRVQITLDGIGNEYLKIKAYVDSSFKFETIISNIERLLEMDIQVLLRLNFDPEKDKYVDIINYLYESFGVRDNLKIYLSWIVADDINSPLDYEENSNPILKPYKKLIEYGYLTNMTSVGVKYRTVHCGAFKKYLVIDPDGKIFKCEHAVKNDTESIGDIDNKEINPDFKKKWIKDVLPLSECEECVYLPFCQGGCRDMVDRNKTAYICTPLKYYIKPLMKLMYKGGENNGNSML